MGFTMQLLQFVRPTGTVMKTTVIALMAAGLCALLMGAYQSAESAAPTYEQFASAIRANDLKLLRQLASVPGNVNVENNLHIRPLHYAALYGSADATRILLEAGADVEAGQPAGCHSIDLCGFGSGKGQSAGGQGSAGECSRERRDYPTDGCRCGDRHYGNRKAAAGSWRRRQKPSTCSARMR